MTPREIITAILGLIIFIVINAGTTYWLQDSLYIVKQYGAYPHWTLILMALPFFSGILMFIAKVPYRIVLIPIGAVISASILFPAYSNKFWAEPPHLFFAFVYAAIVAGMALIPNQRPLQQARDIWFLIYDKLIEKFSKGKKRKRRAKKPVKPKPVVKKAKPKKRAGQKPLIIRFFESEGYANVLETSKHLITLASLLLSVYGIMFMGK